jgi:hypothetical protein
LIPGEVASTGSIEAALDWCLRAQKIRVRIDQMGYLEGVNLWSHGDGDGAKLKNAEFIVGRVE